MKAVITLVIMLLIAAATASGQEAGVGAGRVEIGAFPGGGIFFGTNSDDNGPNFGNYALGTAVTVNFNKWVGAEGEVGGAIGIEQNMIHHGAPLTSQKTPNMFGYAGNLIVNPVGNDRAVVPYVAGGLGGLTVFASQEVEPLGIVSTETYLTGNAGGGVKWFASRHVGLRGDGRFIAVKNKDSAPFFGTENNRYGFRFYGGLLLTY